MVAGLQTHNQVGMSGVTSGACVVAVLEQEASGTPLSRVPLVWIPAALRKVTHFRARSGCLGAPGASVCSDRSVFRRHHVVDVG